MFKSFLTFYLSLFLSLTSVGKGIVTIEGLAPSYVGDRVEVYEIQDYLSMLTTRIASGEVKSDSTFTVTFFNESTRKLRIKVGKKHFHIYAQPGANYKIYVEKSSPYTEAGSLLPEETEFFFVDLDSTDINYKVLMFEDATLEFLKRHYNHKELKSPAFGAHLDTFKLQASEFYKEEEDEFFKTYVRFSFASLDNLAFSGSRNRYEKYDFYIKPETVWYQNDRYMDYVLNYYDKYAYELSDKVNEAFYQGIIKSSPTKVMNALGADYALDNIKLREMVMIKMLGDVFYSGDYPQTNILTMLDSLTKHALFPQNGEIAGNLKYRLIDLVPGGKMPDFFVKVNGERMAKSDFSGKHLYVQFIQEGAKKSENDIELMRPLYDKYLKYTEFLTVVVTENENLIQDPSPYIKKHKMGWKTSFVSPDDPLLKSLNVASYPHYLLMDATGNVVAAPALSPRPDNEYETIDKTLFSIKKRREQMEKEGN
ncbi:MAG: hypothetical protein R3277_11025 [Brumimicrobium sp.]|nr:hypothetical protein [Brumimicrobium sp.]